MELKSCNGYSVVLGRRSAGTMVAFQHLRYVCGTRILSIALRGLPDLAAASWSTTLWRRLERRGSDWSTSGCRPSSLLRRQLCTPTERRCLIRCLDLPFRESSRCTYCGRAGSLRLQRAKGTRTPVTRVQVRFVFLLWSCFHLVLFLQNRSVQDGAI